MNAEPFTFCQFSAHFLLHLTQETYLYAYAQFVVQYSFLVKKSPLSLLPLRGGHRRHLKPRPPPPPEQGYGSLRLCYDGVERGGCSRSFRARAARIWAARGSQPVKLDVSVTGRNTRGRAGSSV
jgi:hypothetical protein